MRAEEQRGRKGADKVGGIGEEGELERKGGERRTRGARGAVEEEESVGGAGGGAGVKEKDEPGKRESQGGGGGKAAERRRAVSVEAAQGKGLGN